MNRIQTLDTRDLAKSAQNGRCPAARRAAERRFFCVRPF